MSTHISSLTSIAFVILVSCHLIRVCTSHVITYEEEKKYQGTFCKSDNLNTITLQKMCDKLVRLAGIENKPEMFQDVICTKGILMLWSNKNHDLMKTSRRDILVCDDSNGFRKALGRGEKLGDVVKYTQWGDIDTHWAPQEKLDGFANEFLTN